MKDLKLIIIEEKSITKKETINKVIEMVEGMVVEISLQPHFPGGASERRKDFQIKILSELAAKLRASLEG